MRLSKWTVTNVVLIALVATGGGLAYASVGAPKAASEQTAARTTQIETGTVMSTVSTSGNVTAPNDVTLDFTNSGKITEIDVKVGQQVTQGEVLARIDSTSAQAALDSAKAQLASAESNLSELEQGATALEKQGYALSNQQAQAQVTQAQTALTNDQQQLTFDQTNFAAAITKAQEQLANDQADENQALANDQTALEQAANEQNVQVQADEAQLTSDENTDCTGSTTSACATSAAAKVAQDKLKIQEDSQSTVSAQQKVASDTLSYQQKLQSDEDAITSAQTSQTQGLAKDQQSIASAKQQIANAQLSLQTTENNNAQKTAAPQQSQIETDQAQIEQAQASVAADQQTLDATALTAPAAGTIGAINDSVGETVSGGNSTSGSSSTSTSTGTGSSSSSSGFITLTNLADLQVVGDIDEADASKMTVGEPATVTLNAITGQEFAASVVAVANTATVSSNVVEYEVTFSLNQSDAAIKPGMTANVTVTTSKVDGVLNVTSTAIHSAGTSSYVEVVGSNGQDKQVDVVVGLKGDTTTQISGDIKAGDTVALPATTTRTTTSTTGTATTTTRTGITGGLTGGFAGIGGGGFGGRG